jgi:DNA invertase Pin-like site-specific DNA recombinase
MAEKRLRCAIYTRKSSEEGLEQGFNSLHAQREACEAYVLSQIGEGWVALATIYDDGGYSGGTMDRPALAQLLADIERGQVDIVVVYKVDRLTRALSDFARIVEIFDRRGVSFVSVTQAFNTTSSMGRLTLNVLLSFAQFEREVTGERIRDKIAASKAKGMWMGGNVPIGYDIPTDLQTRALVVNEAEAETVRLIFRRYLELGAVRHLAADLRTRGVTTKPRVCGSGRTTGGGPWLEGPLYHLLKNQIYRGDIVHKGRVHSGRHQSIIDEETFEAVQRQLEIGGKASAHAHRCSGVTSILTGRIFDDRGHPMSPVSARREGRLYRYYVSQALIRRERGDAGSLPRVPAHAIEALVEHELAERVDARTMPNRPSEALQRVVVASEWIELTLDPAMVSVRGEGPSDAGHGAAIRVPAKLKVFGGAKQLVGPRCDPIEALEPDLSLQKAIARGRRWEAQLASGERSGSDDIATAEGVQSRYVDKLMRLAWLSPEIVQAILDGRRLQSCTLTELINMEIPMAWTDQRTLLPIVNVGTSEPTATLGVPIGTS